MGDGGPPAITWRDDNSLVVGDETYVLLQDGDGGDDLKLYKPRLLVECYEPVIEEFQGASIVELGIYAGGSTAYLAQRCRPRHLVAFDVLPGPAHRLDRFVADHGLEDVVRLHHGVDQADRDALRSRTLDALDPDDPWLDLVIDDASHRYEPTLASFEALFPLLRPGGLYLIEDWNPEDWLLLELRAALASRSPDGLDRVERRLARELPDPEMVVGPAFRRWFAATVADPTAPDHAALTDWFEWLDRHDRTERQATVRGLLDEAVLSEPPVVPDAPAAPTLGTLAAQLLLSVKRVSSPVTSVSVTPFWIAVRRGGPVPDGGFALEPLADDPFGVLTDERWHRPVRPR